MLYLKFLLVTYLFALSSALAQYSKDSTSQIRRQTSSTGSSTDPVVNLEDAIYQGYFNSTSKLNIFKGIRYAAAPIGTLRWQLPQAPAISKSKTILANSDPPRCPQTGDSTGSKSYSFTKASGYEDCLFLNVYQPPNATNLPVLFWIHGGGYGDGQANYNFAELIATNSYGFIVVVIQYRLGAFGFLSSAEVATYGTVNAGLYDMHFALQWVKTHISGFGGDPSRVTIAGESSGAGAVMLLAMANGGSDGTQFFNNIIVASPYLPMQWQYNGSMPTQTYKSFAQAAGCSSHGDTADSTVFACLQGQDTTTLQNASAYVSAMGTYGQWAFLPVTDGKFLQKRPTEQLLAGEVNGLRILSGNNADEGAGFVPQNIQTESDFNNYIQDLFPLMGSDTLAALESTYSISPTTAGPRFSTLGDSGPTALNQSNFGTGQQQRADNLYAETTFVCPSYWLASAFSSTPAYTKRSDLDGSNSNWKMRRTDKQAWKYQFSVPPGEHGIDLDAYYDASRESLGKGTLSAAFRTAVQQMWGRFIMNNDPTLPQSVITNITSGGATGDDIVAAGTGTWPLWQGGSGTSESSYKMLNLNMTGGQLTSILWKDNVYVMQYAGSGLKAKFDIVDAWGWEGGRGKRCQFWAVNGASVPE